MSNYMNRMWNVQNPNQGDRKKVLCVCSAGLLRSPTTAVVLSQEPFNFNTRAVGVDAGHALIPIDPVHIAWADTILCMEQRHADKVCDIINMEFKDDFHKKKIYVLNIPDRYEYMHPELQEIIKKECEIIFL